MSEQTLDAWLSRRSPGIPPAFLPRLLRDGEGTSAGPGWPTVEKRN